MFLRVVPGGAWVVIWADNFAVALNVRAVAGGV